MKRNIRMLPAVVCLLAPLLAACGGSGAGTAAKGGPVVIGTTDETAISADNPAPLDPAASYDIGGWNILGNTFQTLLSYPRTGTTPVPDAASSCRFTDAARRTYDCDLRPGLVFSNGDPLTSTDVKYSVDRMLSIADDNGPYTLLDNVDQVATQGPSRVVFHLKSSDATFPFKLATPAAAIVDHKVYPAHHTYTGYRIVGSGPYVLTSFVARDNAVFDRNPHYKGAVKIANKSVQLRFYDKSASMVIALKDGNIDVANRAMTPPEIASFQNSEKFDLVEAPGAEIRFLVFNMKDSTAGSYAVRKALAQAIDRQALVHDVYAGAAEPLYSMIPQGVAGHTNSFFDSYHPPYSAAARHTLTAAGLHLPVPLHLTYTTDHYGEFTGKEFAELKKQLDATGLFKVTVQGLPWSSYDPNVIKGRYSVYGMGWFADFPDPEDYLAPFFGKDNSLGNDYDNSTIENRLIPAERRIDQRGDATGVVEQAEGIMAHDIPFLPLWQGKQYLVARNGITGAEWALNASSQLQFWELGHGTTT